MTTEPSSIPWDDLKRRVAAEPRGLLQARLTAVLRKMINSGEFAVGQQLPSEPELEAKSGVSRSTVRLALATLAREGLIETRHGRGTFVRERLVFTVLASQEEGVVPAPGKDAFKSAVSLEGRKPVAIGPDTALRSASAEIAERLKVDEGAPLVVRRYLRSIDDRPWSIQESYYPTDLVQGTLIMTADDIPHGAIRELARNGHGQEGYHDEVTCRMPLEEETRFFDIAASMPVLEVFRTAYSAVRPIRLTITVYAGDSTTLAYDVGDIPVERG